MMKNILTIVLAIFIIGGGLLFVPGDFETREHEVEQWKAEKQFLTEQNKKLKKLESMPQVGGARSQGAKTRSSFGDTVLGTKSRFKRSDKVVTADSKLGDKKRMGVRAAELSEAQVGKAKVSDKAKIQSNASRIQTINVELEERATKKAQTYDQVLKAKSALKGLLKLDAESEDEALEEASSDEAATHLKQVAASQLAVVQEQAREKINDLAAQLKSLQDAGKDLSLQKKESEAVLKTLTTQAQMLKVKVDMGKQSLGASRFERVQKEYKLCTASKKSLEKKLAKQTSQLEKRLSEYKALQPKWAEQKALLEGATSQ